MPFGCLASSDRCGIQCGSAECAQICPVDCIHFHWGGTAGYAMVNCEECVQCGACEWVCPIPGVIFTDTGECYCPSPALGQCCKDH